MKTASPAMVALLNSGGPYLLADLYTFTLAGGTILRYTPYDVDLSTSGYTWKAVGPSPGAPVIRRTQIRQAVGVQVNTMSLDISSDGSHLINGVPWMQAARRGAFDGTTVLLERTAMAPPANTAAGKYWKFSGFMADIEVDRLTMKANISSPESILNRNIPVNIFQSGCRNTLFDDRCSLGGVVKESYGTNSAVSSGSTRSAINCGLTQAAGYFTLGTLTMTSGAMSGLSRSIKSYAPGIIGLAVPLVSMPSPGDTFRAYAGCDKQMATCDGSFGNLANFRAETFIPVPETAL